MVASGDLIISSARHDLQAIAASGHSTSTSLAPRRLPPRLATARTKGEAANQLAPSRAAIMVQSMAFVELRHFVVDAGFDPDIKDFTPRFTLRSCHSFEVDLAVVLEANTMAERDVDRELRYRVLQHELRMILSYLNDEGQDGRLRLDAENFAATAGHIKRFVSESVGLGMLTAAVQEYFAWEFGPDAIASFDVLPGELKGEFGTGGVRPDLLFDFKDGERVLAGEARGRSEVGPSGMATRRKQHQRMAEMLRWSSDHGGYPVTMTWTYLGGSQVQVDLFTVSDRSVGSLRHVPPAGSLAVGLRRQFTDDATVRGELRAARLFQTAPPVLSGEPRRLFGREVRGDWVTADLVRSSKVRLFLGAMEDPVPPSDLRAARSRGRRSVEGRAAEYETAISDRLLIVVARSESPEPEWPRIEAFIESAETDE